MVGRRLFLVLATTAVTAAGTLATAGGAAADVPDCVGDNWGNWTAIGPACTGEQDGLQPSGTADSGIPSWVLECLKNPADWECWGG